MTVARSRALLPDVKETVLRSVVESAPVNVSFV
jgi:hypothetical protein